MASPHYILDTNILVHYVRSDAVWRAVRNDYQLLIIEPRPMISIASVGELRSLALQFEWGPKKLDQMEFILGYLDEIAIDSPDLVKTYATIDAYAQKIGKSPGKNDLWIAATTIQFGARLLTTDRDFDWLDPIFLKRDLISSRV